MPVNLQRKLEAWQRAGLLGADAAERILAYEQAHEERAHRPLALLAVGSLGGLSIATGLVALVASNWDGIPSGVKLGAALALAAALSAAIVHAEQRAEVAVAGERRAASWPVEVLLVVQFGFVLAAIGLVAQVYHLGGAPYEALLAWSALTFPLMTRARSVAVATIWITGLHVTIGAVLGEVADSRGALGESRGMLAASLAYLVPLACLAAAGSPALARLRPALVRALRAFGWAELALAASLGPSGFYWDARGDDVTTQARVGLALATAATALVATLALRGERRGAQLVLGAALVASFAAYVGPSVEAAPLAASAFIGFWAAVAFAGHRARRVRLLNLATAMIGLRILIVYFELFGSLLDTGLALVTGGALTLALTWLWVRRSRRFQRELAPREPREPPGPPEPPEPSEPGSP